MAGGVVRIVRVFPSHHSRIRAAGIIAFIAVSMVAAYPALADLADLTRELDGVRTALDKAAADAQAGRVRALRSSLKGAQEVWSRFFVGYRGWGSGTDPNWMADIDAIQSEFMNATNAVTPGNNMPLAAASLKRIQELLAGLRERNDVPDVDAAAKELTGSLNEVQKSMKALQGQAIGPDTLAALSEQWVGITEAWTSFNQVLIEANTLNLSEGDLAKLKRRVERQSVLFEAVGKALGNANLSSGLASVSSAIDGLRALASQLAAEEEDESTGESKPKLDPGRKRGLNFR